MKIKIRIDMKLNKNTTRIDICNYVIKSYVP